MNENKPKIAAKSPAVLTLEPGTYWWCRCGHSQKNPFCDGSHQQVTGFSPLEFTLGETTRIALCRCKHTGAEPRCDGSHKRLD